MSKLHLFWTIKGTAVVICSLEHDYVCNIVSIVVVSYVNVYIAGVCTKTCTGMGTVYNHKRWFCARIVSLFPFQHHFNCLFNILLCTIFFLISTLPFFSNNLFWSMLQRRQFWQLIILFLAFIKGEHLWAEEILSCYSTQYYVRKLVSYKNWYLLLKRPSLFSKNNSQKHSNVYLVY